MNFQSIDVNDRNYNDLIIFTGKEDQNLALLEKAFDTKIVLRDQEIKILDGPNALSCRHVILRCFDLIDTYGVLSDQDVNYLISLEKRNQLKAFDVKSIQSIGKTKSGKLIYPKTIGQAKFCTAMRENDIVFATGVAGTGKTYLAVAYAVSLLKQEKIEKIILTRPAVEAGESLGFLPGDMKDKVDPYLRPLYDALYDMLGQDTVDRYIEKQVIEIAPLAFMRGRTLNKAVVILDEAQNTTSNQMKMFLTRMGRQAKMIINGDATQIDLIKKSDSGLMQAVHLLDGIDGIAMVHLHESDVVRHPLVQKILARYASIENND